MSTGLYWNTVSEILRSGLTELMKEPLFKPFRLVGGTSLSLQIGHRKSVDIDLFTDAVYDSIDFGEIDGFLRQHFNYVSPGSLPEITGMGISYITGSTPKDSFKLDLFYSSEPFIYPLVSKEEIRMASMEEIAAMKFDVVQRVGRKKDFWDIHALLDRYSINRMMATHKQRYPYTHDEVTIRSNFLNYKSADEDFDPVCLLGKYWEIIKLDIM